MKKNTHQILPSKNWQINEPNNLNRRKFLKFLGAGSAIALIPFANTFSSDTNKMFAGKAIPTATGEIFPNQMGITSLHEHIALQADPVQREKSIAFAISELKKAKTLGLQTIVEVRPTTYNPVTKKIEPIPEGIREVSLASGVNVICCTGFYTFPKDQQTLTVEECEKKMLTEIEEGITGSGIRPAVIKIATKGLPITQSEKNVFTAAAHVQKKYHLPICTHAVSGCVEQQQILESEGADLSHCYFSHVEATFGWSGRNVQQEIDYLETLVKKGSSISFNNFGNWNHTKPEDLALIIRELTKRGYDNRMVATMDLTWSFENGNIKILWGDTNVNGNDRTYSYLLDKAVPWMKENGVPEKSVNKFIIDNPRRIFTW